MRTINLDKGVAALVDDSDFDRINKTRWRAAWSHKTKSFYAVRDSKQESGKWKTVLLHREVLGQQANGLDVDHKDHNTLNCQRNNLRACTRSQNMMNRKGAASHSESGCRGVRRVASGKWIARVRINGKLIHIGTYATMKEADEAAKEARAYLFGEFA